MQKNITHDTATATLPPEDNLPFSQNMGHDGKDGTPHKPLLPRRLHESKPKKMENHSSVDYMVKK